MPLRALVLLLLAFILPAPATAQNAAGPPVGSFKLVLDPALQTTPYSGRVYIALGKDGRGEPRTQMGNWFSPIQILAIDVTNIAPGSPISVGPTALSFPKAFKDIPAGAYSAQAVARRSLESSTPGQGDGDLYSAPLSITFDPAAPAAADLKLDKPVTPRPFKETDRVKLVEIDSPLLSKFYGRPVKTRAGVILPKAYKDDPAQSYPTLYFIGGFGSDHRSAQGMARMLENGAPDNLLVVIPDPSSYLGHTVFADSANNGPRGQSLIQELIPAVESRFHGARSGERRFVSGISSGGWSSLWLQITYPDQFAGVWSHCPDPVDFRDFQRINLYAPGANMYRDQTGARRPLARGGSEDKPLLWYDDFVGQETVMGPGGQIHAFEGVFSPRAAPTASPSPSSIAQPAPSTPPPQKPGSPTTSASSWSATGRPSAPSSRARSISTPAPRTPSTLKVPPSSLRKVLRSSAPTPRSLSSPTWPTPSTSPASRPCSKQSRPPRPPHPPPQHPHPLPTSNPPRRINSALRRTA